MYSSHGIMQLLQGWSNLKPEFFNPKEQTVSVPNEDDT